MSVRIRNGTQVFLPDSIVCALSHDNILPPGGHAQNLIHFLSTPRPHHRPSSAVCSRCSINACC